MTHQPFVLERTFNVPAATIWKALTDKDEMKKWYFDLREFTPKVGFRFSFTGGKEDGEQYLHLCKITNVVPGKKLRYSWRYEGYEGDSFVTFELFEEGNRTRLKLTHEGLETFPTSNPDLAAHNFAAGWSSIINESLAAYLENK